MSLEAAMILSVLRKSTRMSDSLRGVTAAPEIRTFAPTALPSAVVAGVGAAVGKGDGGAAAEGGETGVLVAADAAEVDTAGARDAVAGSDGAGVAGGIAGATTVVGTAGGSGSGCRFG